MKGSCKSSDCAREDGEGKKSLIDFLVRNNVLPKYGFPVDTVELLPDVSAVGSNKALRAWHVISKWQLLNMRPVHR